VTAEVFAEQQRRNEKNWIFLKVASQNKDIPEIVGNTANHFFR